MKRKDLFKDGFRSVFQFAFEKTDGVTEAIRKAWEDENKPTIAVKKRKEQPKSPKRPKKKPPQIFRTLSLPPGNTPDFLTLCTGCNECVYSCPYHILFPVMTETSGKNYPFFDPNAKACHLCTDYPCIEACPEGALSLAEVNEENPRFGIAKGILEHCINAKTGEKTCNACETACPIEKTIGFRKNLPYFSSHTCTGCGLCVEVCPSFPKAIQVKTVKLKNFD